jgi:hypothetical protein
LHIELRDPAGHDLPARSGNALLRGDALAWPIPFAATDAAGDWTISVRDILGGARATTTIQLLPAS